VYFGVSGAESSGNDATDSYSCCHLGYLAKERTCRC